MKRKARCIFCFSADRAYYISSPERNKRKVYICSECVEMCTYILLEKKYEKIQKEGV
jgi:ATP-dependent protease Clp ATPase subunit